MPSTRRSFLAAGSSLLLADRPAAQPAYPNRPIRMIVGFAAGGGADVQARVVAKALGERLKQPVVVENRVGAGSQVGGIAIARAEPDGYTIGIATVAYAIQAGIDPSMEFDPLNDLAHIAMVGGNPYVLVAHPQLPARTLAELLAWMRAQPEVAYASAGVGSGLHMAGEMFRDATRLKLLHVPYRGEGPAINDVAAGQVPIMFSSITNALALIQSGKVRPIAVSGAARSPELPDTPTMAEGGMPGFEMGGWMGLVAPRRVPPAILARLAQETNAVLESVEVRAQLAKLGSLVRTTASPAEFTAYLQREIARYRDIGAKAGIRISK